MTCTRFFQRPPSARCLLDSHAAIRLSLQQAVYHVVSLGCELAGRPRALARACYGAAAVVGGLGALVLLLYLFFWGLQA